MNITGNQLRSVFDAMHDGVVGADLSTTRLCFANRAMCVRTGYSADELLGLSVAALHPPGAVESTMEAFGNLASGAVSTALNIPVQRKDGSVWHVDVSAALTEVDGEKMLVGILRDATERRLIEADLQRTSEDLDRCFRMSLDLLCVIDADDRFCRLSLEWERALGYDPRELIGTRYIERVHPNDRAATLETLRLSRQTVVEGFINRIRHRDGTWRWLEWRCFPSGDRISAVARDITEHMAAEARSLETTLRFEAAFRASPIAIVIVRVSDGRFVDINPAATAIFGWAPKDVIGRTARDIDLWVRAEDRTSIAADAAEHAGQVDHREVPLRHKDGHIVQCSVSLREIVISDVPHLMFLCLDITERQQAEKNLLRAQKLESIGILAGGIAHDFNNLLTGLFGNLELAQDSIRQGDRGDALASLEVSLGVIERARELTRQLLTFSKGGAPVKAPGSLVDAVRQSVHVALSGSNVQAEIACSEDIWPCEFDPGQIQQVLDNLVINAKQAMPDGGVLHVRVDNVRIATASPTRLAPGRYVRCRFTDQGPGIPREDLTRIFDPFFTTKPGAGGLGLATSWSIVQRHSGHIGVESDEGRGAVFTIYLPASNVTVVPPEPPHAATPTVQPRVLVLDDEPYIRTLAERMLGTLGYSVQVAETGEQALDSLVAAETAGHPFDVAILDLTVPGGFGGREVMARLRNACPGFAAIATSGYADDPVMAEPERYGFRASLGKPYRRQEAAAVLQRVLAQTATARRLPEGRGRHPG